MAKMKKDESKDAKLAAKIRPLGDRVLIKELEEKEGGRTDTGIFIPDSVKEDRGAKRGEVMAVGPGRYDDGELIPMSVKEGDKVLYQWGDTVKIGETEYVVVSESNLIAIIR